MTSSPSQSATPPVQLKQIVADVRVLGGQEVVSGTRIPAAAILAYLRAGYSSAEIHQDYPSLTTNGILAVEAWAAEKFGPHWMSTASPRPD